MSRTREDPTTASVLDTSVLLLVAGERADGDGARDPGTRRLRLQVCERLVHQPRTRARSARPRHAQPQPSLVSAFINSRTTSTTASRTMLKANIAHLRKEHSAPCGPACKGV